MDSLLAMNAEIYLYVREKDGFRRTSISKAITTLVDSITLKEDAETIYSEYPIIQNKWRMTKTAIPARLRYNLGNYAYCMSVLAEEDGFLTAYFNSVVLIVRRLRRIYRSCFEAINEQPTACRKCELLHLAVSLKNELPGLIASRYASVSDKVSAEKETCYQDDLNFICPPLLLPFTDLYENFYAQYGSELKKKYGSAQDTRNYHKDRISPAGIIPDNYAPTEYHFWENPFAELAVKEAIFGYAYAPENKDTDSKRLQELKSADIAKLYLEILDKYLMRKTRHTVIEADSASKTLRWMTRDFEEAIYLWLLADIMSNKELAICKMCGSVFEPSRPNNLYCKRHTQWQINYFNRRVNRMNALIEEENSTIDSNNQLND